MSEVMYSVSLTTNSTTYITTITTASTDEDSIFELAIQRIKDEDGFDLSNRRFVDTTFEVLEVWS